MDDQKGLRMTVEFPPTSIRRLQSLKDVLEAASYIAVLRDAVKLYYTAVRARKNGGRGMVIIEADGRMTDPGVPQEP